jgi:hypothetical protein
MLMMLMTVLAAVYSRISELVDLYKFSLGAIAYCVVRMKTVLADLGDDKAVQLAEEAKAKQERAQQLQYDWEKQKQEESSRSEGARKKDDEIDKTLSSIAQTAEGLADADVDSKPSRLAQELLDDLFPNGVYHITSKPFDDQHTTVNALLERLEGDYSEHIQALNLGPMVERLESLNEEFRERLDMSNRQVAYDEVEAAKKDAEEAFHRLIARVMCAHSDDMETFNRIMEPVAEQTELARRHYQRRGTLPPVDPESGEPIDDSENTPENDGGSPDDLQGEGQNSGGSPEGESDGESEGESEEN